MTGMREQHVVAATLGALATLLGPSGFLRSGESFRRPWSGGFDLVAPLTNEYFPRVELDFGFSVRIDAVESFLARVTALTDYFRPDSVTAVARVGELRGRGDEFLYRLHADSELNAAIEDFCDFWRSDGAGHFDRFHGPETMERAFNESPDLPCIYSRNEARRVLRGVALAHLYRPDDLPRIIDEYRWLYVCKWRNEELVRAFDLLAAQRGDEKS